MEKIKVGVFGAYRGMSMIRTFLAYREATLVAVCDKYQPALEKVKKAADEAGMEVALYEDFEEFIKHDMDAVVLANYGNEHAPFAIRCLNEGKHVMSECVPCETMAQAVELVETVERTGLVYTYAENCCYMRNAWEMWRKYEEGAIGDVVYAECEYLHDAADAWPQISYGDPTHWRNRAYATYYCTHSLGPIIMATGRRPVQVIGFENPLTEEAISIGVVRGPGIEMVTLDNGAVVKSINGWYKRKDAVSWNYEIYGSKGMMEGGRFKEDKEFNMWRQGDKIGKGEWERYDPVNEVARDLALKATNMKVHGGADFYAPYFFIQKILGKPDGEKWAIDVYQALDMSIPGILAWRSALNGNVPVKVPNLRNPEERDAYRNDHACTTPEVAGDQLLPSTTHNVTIPQETFDRIKYLWENKLDVNGDPLPEGKQ